MGFKTPLRADDGSVLEAKEGIIMDSEGQPLTEKQAHAYDVHVKTVKFPTAGLAGLIAIPIAVAMGFAFFAVIAGVMFLLILIGLVSKLFYRPRS